MSIDEHKAQTKQVLKEVLRRLHKAYQKFFDDNKQGRKTGRPKFRSWKRKWMSLVYPKDAGIKLIGNNRLKITFGKDASGFQLRIIVFLNEPLKSVLLPSTTNSESSVEGNKKSNSFHQVVITKDSLGNYYACFALEKKDPKKYEGTEKVSDQMVVDQKVIAIDPNHKNSFVGFDGTSSIELARCYVQKNLDKSIDYVKSRRDKCLRQSKAVHPPVYGGKEGGKEGGSIKYWKPSRKWKQFNRVLNKLYAKRREQMKLFAYTIAHWLERHYDKVLYGDYTPFAGLKNTHRSMLSQGYVGYLRRIVKWVFEKGGKVVEEVSERKSTKTCHCCGNEMDMPPGKRSFVCSNEKCNASLPRDVNSAINLYNWHFGEAIPRIGNRSSKKIPDAKISLHLTWSPFFGLEGFDTQATQPKEIYSVS